jgi:dolichyl-phosphate-mannose--protein O-mannosyl transferase
VGRHRRAVFHVTGLPVVLVAVDFFYLYPALTAGSLPYQDWYKHMWFHSWI